MKLKIKQTSWSGFNKDYKPNEIENEYDINVNQKYVIKVTNISFLKDGELVNEEKEIFSFEIKEINSDNILIHTFQSFSDSENGVDLMSDKKDFIITLEKELKLVTQTMDYGDIFILTLIK